MKEFIYQYKNSSLSCFFFFLALLNENLSFNFICISFEILN